MNIHTWRIPESQKITLRWWGQFKYSTILAVIGLDGGWEEETGTDKLKKEIHNNYHFETVITKNIIFKNKNIQTYFDELLRTGLWHLGVSVFGSQSK